MEPTLDKIQKLELKLAELNKRYSNALRLHQELIEHNIIMLESGIKEKQNRIRNNNYSKKFECCKCQDKELVLLLEPILNAIKLIYTRLDQMEM
jgi:hypothetical protein